MRIKPCILVAFSCLLAASAHAGSAVERLKALIGEARTYQAEFRQVVVDEKGAELQVSTGEIAVSRPGRFRWSSNPPYNQLLVADGKELWRYDEDLEQVTVSALDNRLGKTPALLLSGDLSALDDGYSVEARGDASFIITPRGDSGNLFESMEVAFRAGKMVRMVMRDSLKQTTTIDYGKVRTNIALDGSLFSFKPPAGVDVFRDEQ